MIRPLFAMIWCMMPAISPDVSDLHPDETITFFTTTGHLSDDGKEWELRIHGWVYERDVSAAALEFFRRALGIGNDDMATDAASKKYFARRAESFVRDNKRGRQVVIRIGDRTYTLPKSAKNGHIEGVIRLPYTELIPWRTPVETGQWQVTFRAVLPENDPRIFEGRVLLWDATGLGVISDIDDTIKISNVLHRKELMRNTFLRPYQAVPGMAELYRVWARDARASFHYVTASPWQLYDPLAAFIEENEFPGGTLYMKDFRWKDHTVFSLLGSPLKYKLTVLEPLLKEYPQRRFVLIGDSGESDPEVYGELARRHPEQVVRILIRNVTNEPAEAARFRKVFADVPLEKWQVFEEPSEVKVEVDRKDKS